MSSPRGRRFSARRVALLVLASLVALAAAATILILSEYQSLPEIKPLPLPLVPKKMSNKL